MTAPANQTVGKPKKSSLGFLAWWQQDADEVAKQVSQYRTLKLTQSARGSSLICCLLSTAMTVGFGRLLGFSVNTIATEAILWLSLGLFMYRGHRWAFITAMVLWTFEKGSMFFGGASRGFPFAQVIWWAVYMKFFYLGLVVERARRGQSGQQPGPAHQRVQTRATRAS